MARLTIRYSGEHEKIFEFLKDRFKADSDAHVFRIALELAYEHENQIKCSHQETEIETENIEHQNGNSKIFHSGYYLSKYHEKADQLQPGDTIGPEFSGKDEIITVTEENLDGYKDLLRKKGEQLLRAGETAVA